MPRVARTAPGGLIYHVLNRGIGKSRLFRSRKEFETFQRCLLATQRTTPMRILAYGVMDTHWHLLLWPQKDGDLARFMLRLTVSHVRRWLIHRDQVGLGHVYHGRYKSFAIQPDGHLATVCRYVERNPVRAGVVKRSRDWLWSSAGQSALPPELRVQLTDLPIPRKKDWIDWIDQPPAPAEESVLHRCIIQGRPYGDPAWIKKIQKQINWREPLPIGRPRKKD